MQFFANANPPQQQIRAVARNPDLSGWNNSQIGTRAGNVEVFGTSWMRDVMVAKQFAPANFVKANSLFNGATDANLGITPKWKTPGLHWTHDLGMAMDLGISNYVDYDHQGATGIANTQVISAPPPPIGWSLPRALTLSAGLSTAANNRQRAAVEDFLSLYWATKETLRDAANGNRWLIVNGTGDIEKTEIQNLLFRGGGTPATNATTSLISKVLIGGTTRKEKLPNGTEVIRPANGYPEIRKVLTGLGIVNEVDGGHEHHFHIYFTPPAPRELSSSQNLLAETFIEISYQAEKYSLTPKVYEGGTSAIVTMNVTQQFDEILIATCQVVLSDGIVPDLKSTLSPAGAASVIYSISGDQQLALTRSSKTIVLTNPKHGSISGPLTTPEDGEIFFYRPNPGFDGFDQVIFSVTLINGKRVQVTMPLEVGGDTRFPPESCPVDDSKDKPGAQSLLRGYLDSNYLHGPLNIGKRPRIPV